jgi:hypothetical protein
LHRRRALFDRRWRFRLWLLALSTALFDRRTSAPLNTLRRCALLGTRTNAIAIRDRRWA